MSITHIFSGLSVRARIIVLGVIPVVGFLAIGLAFLIGDAEVGRPSTAVHRNTEVADASRDLKIGLLTMRAATTDFVAHPSDAEVKNFDEGQALAIAASTASRALARRPARHHHAAAHHGARPQGELRQPRHRTKLARFHRKRGRAPPI